MPHYIIYTYVNNDGLGDFSHLDDIAVTILSNPHFNDINLTIIVEIRDIGRDKESELKSKEIFLPFIKNKLIQLEQDFPDRLTTFCALETQYQYDNPVIQKKLNEADQLLIVSYDGQYCRASEQYTRYCQEGIPIKFIGEHERKEIKYSEPHLIRSLGLSDGCYGLKIKDKGHACPDDAWNVIEQNDPTFASELLFCTNSSDFAEFNRRYLLVPCYFNNTYIFSNFLQFLSITLPSYNENVYLNGLESMMYNLMPVTSQSNDKWITWLICNLKYATSSHKEIVIYHSGAKLDRMNEEHEDLSELSFIQSLEIYIAGKWEPVSISLGNLGAKIKIFSGYRVNDASYNAIYQLSKLAGVSGDNTFELCLSHNILPFYYSTNRLAKMPTLEALIKIIQRPELPLSPQVREAYKWFFSIGLNERLSIRDKKIASLNVSEMIKQWPVVTDYLRKNNNFYNCLEEIIIEELSPEALPVFFQDKPSFTQSLI